MKTTLTKAFREFLDDLSNVVPLNNNNLQEKSHDEIVKIVKEEIEEKKTNDIKFLNIGKTYMNSNNKTKRAILSHLNNLKILSKENPEEITEDIATISTSDELATLLPQVLNHDNLQRMANVVTRHKGNSENVVDILKNVVNSEEFEELAKEFTKSLKRN